MRAVVLDQDRRSLTERDIAEPAISAPDQVLFRLARLGVCGTDRELAAFRLGYGPPGDSYLVPGHEATGEVVASSSPLFRPGDFVVPSVRRACEPPCPSCRRNRRDLCLTGRYTERGIVGAHGYFTELALDAAADLTRVPSDAAQYAVLIEPLSVVEKAITQAGRLHEGEPRNALVLGAGSIGLLAAAVLHLRGFNVEIVSVEAAASPRGRLAATTGAEYRNKPGRPADIAIEAAGAPAALTAGMEALAPLGVLVILGSTRGADPLPALHLILGNRIVAGSVNASPHAFELAAVDLPRLPRALLAGMIEERPFADYRRSFLDPAGGAPKIVHLPAV